jgi:hypothetical protein
MYNQAGTVSYIYYSEKGTGQGLPPLTPPQRWFQFVSPGVVFAQLQGRKGGEPVPRCVSSAGILNRDTQWVSSRGNYKMSLYCHTSTRRHNKDIDCDDTVGWHIIHMCGRTSFGSTRNSPSRSTKANGWSGDLFLLPVLDDAFVRYTVNTIQATNPAQRSISTPTLLIPIICSESTGQKRIVAQWLIKHFFLYSTKHYFELQHLSHGWEKN